VPEGGQVFERFTPRARNTIAAAGRLAAEADCDSIAATHLIVGQLSEPDALAAKIFAAAGITSKALSSAFELPAPKRSRETADAAALRELRFDSTGKAALKGTLKAALRLGHNYIGTEHLLLGVLFADGDAAHELAGLGLTIEVAESRLAEEFAKLASS
jgi:ATP-dependent Clp protease ATP-binding subunit ClpA